MMASARNIHLEIYIKSKQIESENSKLFKLGFEQITMFWKCKLVKFMQISPFRHNFDY